MLSKISAVGIFLHGESQKEKWRTREWYGLLSTPCQEPEMLSLCNLFFKTTKVLKRGSMSFSLVW